MFVCTEIQTVENDALESRIIRKYITPWALSFHNHYQYLQTKYITVLQFSKTIYTTN